MAFFSEELAALRTHMPPVNVKILWSSATLHIFSSHRKLNGSYILTCGNGSNSFLIMSPLPLSFSSAAFSGSWHVPITLSGRGIQALGFTPPGGANEITILLFVAVKNSIVCMNDFWNSALENICGGVAKS